jgi:hypothetical protein
MRTAPIVLSALLSVAPAARAAAADSPEAAQPPGAEPAAPPWSLRFEAQGLSVDEGAVRSAVGRELARARVQSGSEPARIAIFVVQGGDLSVRYRSPAGTELSRSVAAPARADEVPEASALLVGNLARDEAGALLAELARPQPASAAARTQPSLPAAESTRGDVPPVLPLDSLNLSLAYPLTLRGDTEKRHFAFELGLFYSRIGALSGAALNLGLSRVDGVARGAQLGGLGYWHGGSGAGARLGGAFGVSSGRFDGVSATGLATLHSGPMAGAQFAGFTSIATGDVYGAQASGFLDYAGSVAGVQAAGLASVSHGPVQGLQLAGAAAIAWGDVQGVQVSVLNVGGSVQGAQIGVLNIAGAVTGTQIGVVNVADSVQGQSIGLVPYTREGGLRIVTWFDSTQPFNMGVRFHAGALYMMPTFAFDPGSAALVSEPSRMRYALGTSLGLRLPFERAFVDIDVNESQRSRGWEYVINEDTLDLRYRVLAGYRIVRRFAAFVGGGIRQHFPQGGPRGGAIQPELSLGMEML